MKGKKSYKGCYYHVYNRGANKNNIFKDILDFERFKRSLVEFNIVDTLGSIYEKDMGSLRYKEVNTNPLVDIIAYAILPNHFHLVLYAHSDDAISKFMQKFGTGYTKFFNNKNDHSGVLFQGPYKIKEITSNEYLAQVSAYVNHNGTIHGFGSQASKFTETSLREYTNIDNQDSIAKAIPHLFEKQVPKDYEKYSLWLVEKTIKERELKRQMKRGEYEGVADLLFD